MRRALIEGEGAHSVRGAVRGQDSGKAAQPQRGREHGRFSTDGRGRRGQRGRHTQMRTRSRGASRRPPEGLSGRTLTAP